MIRWRIKIYIIYIYIYSYTTSQVTYGNGNGNGNGNRLVILRDDGDLESLPLPPPLGVIMERMYQQIIYI